MKRYRATYEFEAGSDDEARTIARAATDGRHVALVDLSTESVYWSVLRLDPNKPLEVAS